AGPFTYSLSERGCAHWDLSVAAPPGTKPGRYFVSARTVDGLGQVLEDTALITVGEPPAPARGVPRDQLDALLAADREAREGGGAVALEPAVLEVAPGECAALAVRLANRTASEIRGESQLISPWGTWCDARPWTQGFTAGPDAAVRLGYTVTPPAGARPGSGWWTLAKGVYFGPVRHPDRPGIGVPGGGAGAASGAACPGGGAHHRWTAGACSPAAPAPPLEAQAAAGRPRPGWRSPPPGHPARSAAPFRCSGPSAGPSAAAGRVHLDLAPPGSQAGHPDCPRPPVPPAPPTPHTPPYH